MRDDYGFILDIDRFSTHDGPGIRMAVFLKGCPLSCAWCHSPESQSQKPQLLCQKARCRLCGHCLAACPRSALTLTAGGIAINRDHCAECFACAGACRTQALRVAGTERSVAEIVEIARRDKIYYTESGGGVTISGGEPLSQAEFTLALMRALREIPVHTAIETCGMGDERALLDIAAYTDLIYYDIKIMDEKKHKDYTGMPNTRVLSNLRAVTADEILRRRVCVRTPCIPGINDSPEEIRVIAEFVRGCGVERMELLPYNAAADAKYEWLGIVYPLEFIESDKDHMERLLEIVNSCIKGREYNG